MWTNISNSFNKAFELIIHPTDLLVEIVNTTFKMSINSTLWSSLLGIALGCLISYKFFKGKKIVQTILRTLMGMPPVAVGILLYLLFSTTGPLGFLHIIYSVKLMVIAQVVLITPIVAGMVETSLSPISNAITPTLKGINIKPLKKTLLLINEGKMSILSAILFAFARSTAEVGAIQIVGGNILHSTRVMTTTIMMNYNSGSFELALALGLILIIISLVINVLATILAILGRAYD